MADRRRRRPSESEGEEGEEETLSTSQASLGSTEDPSHSGEDERDRRSPCESEGEHAEALSEYESAEEDREADEDSQAEQGDSDTEHEDTRGDDDTETEDTQETEETQETGETLDTTKTTVSTDDSDKDKKLERQSGDGSEAPDSEDQAENLDDDEDRRNPAFIPRKGDFFEHDIRGEEDEKQPGRPPVKGRKKLWQDEGKWQHDLFNEDEQRPKPVEELIAIYGYDPRRESSPDNIRPRRGRRPPRGGGRGGRPPPRTLRDFVERPPPPRRGFPPRNRTDVQTRDRAQYTQDVRQWATNVNNYRDNGPLDNVVSDENRNQPQVSRQKPSEERAVTNVMNNVTTSTNSMPKNGDNGVTVPPVPVKAVVSTDSEHQYPAPQEKRSYTRYRRSAQGPRTSPPQQQQQQHLRKRMENLSLQHGEETAAQDRGHADGSPQHPEERHGPNRSDRPKRYSSLRQRPMPEQVVPPNMVKGVTYYNQGYRGEQYARGSTPPVVDGPIQPHPTGPPAPPHQGMIVSDVNLPPGMAHPAMYNPTMTMAPPVPPQLLPPPFFSAGGMVNYAAPPNPVSSYAPIPPAGPTAPTPNVPPVYTSPHPPSAQVVRGVTYFNNQMPPQVLKRSPARRPNAAIPIEPPPDVRGDQTHSEEGGQPTEA